MLLSVYSWIGIKSTGVDSREGQVSVEETGYGFGVSPAKEAKAVEQVDGVEYQAVDGCDIKEEHGLECGGGIKIRMGIES